MKLKGLPAYVALAGGAIAIYAFVRSGGWKTAQRDASRATGGLVPAPTPTPPMTNPTTGEPAFGIRNPWANDPIFAPLPYSPIPGIGTGALPGYTPPAGGTATFGVGLR